MSLSDPSYFGFLLLVFLLFHALRPGAPRRILLLAASYYFYFQFSHFFIAVLLFVTAVTYYGALLLRVRAGHRHAFPLFALLVLVVLAPLLLFKYLGAFLEVLPGGTGWAALALPVGISFFTFAALGYLIDVYLDVLDPEPRPLHVALFLAFFPLLTAGPIERGGRLLPQFEFATPFTAARGFGALRLIFLGLVLKVVLADLLAVPVNLFYAAPAAFTPAEHLFGVGLYAFYLYADFAGYSLIAIGSARLLGLEVRPNFQEPFLSATVPEFWRHWHISLSSWVRDYLFSPLRMQWRRSPAWGLSGALFLSFVILGLWHGAKWGYLAFGVIHGIYCVVSGWTLPRRNALWARLRVPPALVHAARVVLTFVLVVLAFVVYRAATLPEAAGIYRSLFSADLLPQLGGFIAGLRHPAALPHPDYALALVRLGWVVPLLIAGDLLARRGLTLEKYPAWLQVVIYNYGLLLIVSQWLTHHGTQPFVYYKF